MIGFKTCSITHRPISPYWVNTPRSIVWNVMVQMKHWLRIDIEGFVDTPNECATCHENVHEDQFVQNGITDCARCHGFEGWGVEDFNHDNTAFKLEGAHTNVACEACHKPYEAEDGQVIVQYKFNSFQCIDCHQ